MAGVAVLDRYSKTLLQYCQRRDEAALYDASLLGDACIREGLGPDDIVAAHLEAMQHMVGEGGSRPADRVALLASAHQFLLEMMIGYGVKHREYLELKLAEAARDADELLRRERDRAEQAVKSENEKTEMLAVIAHELGTPLTIARGNAEMLQRALTDDDIAGEVATSARELATAIERISTVTSQIVAATNDQQPEVSLEPQVLWTIADRCIRWARALGDEKGVSVESECPRDLWVMGDREGLISLITNLLQNAVRYTPSGGAVRLMCRKDGDAVLLQVSDNGIGMNDAVRARIFEKFYRAPEARKKSARGLGMGLVIVRRLVHAHNGRLEVDSEEGVGTTFRVHLPKASEAEIEVIEEGTDGDSAGE